MGRKSPHPPGKVWADENTSYEKAKDCVLALPWATCAICGAVLLRTAKYRKLSPCCESHGLECGEFVMRMMSTPIFARTSRLLHDWHADVYQAMAQVHAHHERRVENLLLNCLQQRIEQGPQPQNRKHRRWLRRKGLA